MEPLCDVEGAKAHEVVDMCVGDASSPIDGGRPCEMQSTGCFMAPAIAMPSLDATYGMTGTWDVGNWVCSANNDWAQATPTQCTMMAACPAQSGVEAPEQCAMRALSSVRQDSEAQSGKGQVAPAQQLMRPRQPRVGKEKKFVRRLDVGIETDCGFGVVGRLIGTAGRNLKHIVSESGGAKVWVATRSSRLPESGKWDESLGPLVVCVCAMSGPSLETAMGLIRELLATVRKEHDDFLQGKAIKPQMLEFQSVPGKVARQSPGRGHVEGLKA